MLQQTTFLTYLQNYVPGQPLPTLKKISEELDVSVGKLREQMAIAAALGLVSIRPGRGMKRLALDAADGFKPITTFGLATGELHFEQLSQLRRGIERSMWHTAVPLLTAEDLAGLTSTVADAQEKLSRSRIVIPYKEHQAFHMGIFGRLDNPFVTGLLLLYWDAYNTSGITQYKPLSYWQQVWDYHANIVQALKDNNYDLGRKYLLDHFDLLSEPS